eukprot:1628166-Pleurochrysis_carterae.AAC.1
MGESRGGAQAWSSVDWGWGGSRKGRETRRGERNKATGSVGVELRAGKDSRRDSGAERRLESSRVCACVCMGARAFACVSARVRAPMRDARALVVGAFKHACALAHACACVHANAPVKTSLTTEAHEVAAVKQSSTAAACIPNSLPNTHE